MKNSGDSRKENRREYAALTIAILAAAFTAWQGWEAHRARTDAHEQFVMAQNNATKSAVNAREDALHALDVETRIANRAAEQAKRSADAADKSNKVALDALHISQAPIIDATVELQGAIVEGQGTKIVGNIRNNGRAGAYEVHGRMRIVAAKLSEEEAYKFAWSDKMPAPTGILSTAFLSPGAGAQLISNGLSLDLRGVESIKDGTATIWVFGKINCRDIFRLPHSLEFCFKYNNVTRSMDICADHNFSK